MPGAVIRIDLKRLREAGYQIPKPKRVRGRFDMPGGGWKIEFPYDIPADFIEVLER